MPKRVEEVRFRIDFVLLAGFFESVSARDELLWSREGVAGVWAEESVDVGVSSKGLRGWGRHKVVEDDSSVISIDIVELMKYGREVSDVLMALQVGGGVGSTSILVRLSLRK